MGETSGEAGLDAIFGSARIRWLDRGCGGDSLLRARLACVEACGIA